MRRPWWKYKTIGVCAKIPSTSFGLNSNFARGSHNLQPYCPAPRTSCPAALSGLADGEQHRKRVCELRASRRHGRYLRLTRGGHPRIDRAKVKAAERRDGKFVVHGNDDTPYERVQAAEILTTIASASDPRA